jgi:hypothetical protein
VHSSPERRRRGRNLLGLALLLSALFHVTAGGIWAGFGHRIVTTMGKILPHPKETPTPRPQDVAPVDTITISQAVVPRQPRRTTPRVAPPKPVRPTVAQAPPPRPAPIPTEVPRATPAPTVPPAPKVVRPERVTAPAPRVAVRTAPQQRKPAPKNALSPQQLAALDAQFRQAISDDQRAVEQGPPQRKQAATSTMADRRFKLVMEGTPQEVSGQGYCEYVHDAQHHWTTGNTSWYYLTCTTTYTDGFTETASIPWPVHFPTNNDPMVTGRRFDLTDPPAGYSLPHPFALSRVTCAYFKSECQTVIDREKANGDPQYGGDPTSP